MLLQKLLLLQFTETAKKVNINIQFNAISNEHWISYEINSLRRYNIFTFTNHLIPLAVWWSFKTYKNVIAFSMAVLFWLPTTENWSIQKSRSETWQSQAEYWRFWEIIKNKQFLLFKQNEMENVYLRNHFTVLYGPLAYKLIAAG